MYFPGNPTRYEDIEFFVQLLMRAKGWSHRYALGYMRRVAREGIATGRIPAVDQHGRRVGTDFQPINDS